MDHLHVLVAQRGQRDVDLGHRPGQLLQQRHVMDLAAGRVLAAHACQLIGQYGGVERLRPAEAFRKSCRPACMEEGVVTAVQVPSTITSNNPAQD